MLWKKGVLRNYAKFVGKHLCQSLFFNKVAGLPATLLKKRLWHRCFPVNFAKFLREISKNTFTFFKNTSGRPTMFSCFTFGRPNVLMFFENLQKKHVTFEGFFTKVNSKIDIFFESFLELSIWLSVSRPLGIY